MTQAESVNRPLLRWHGAKWGNQGSVARWVIGWLPYTKTYLEPFFGSGAILFNKPRSLNEHVCELDERVTDFFEIVRTKPHELIGLLNSTPYSRAELERCHEHTDDKLESARRFMVRSWQGIGSLTTGKNSWRMVTNIANYGNPPALSWHFDHIKAASNRLMGVQIDNRDCFNVIPRFNYEHCTIYADPPYLFSTRKSKNKTYAFEFDEQKHVNLLNLLLNHTGAVVISGYDSELYKDMLADWHVDKKEVATNNRNSKATEHLWINPHALELLNGQQEMLSQGKLELV